MSNTLSYRAGTLDSPSLPWARIADTGVQGIELNWSDGLTAAAVEAALEPHGLRVTSLSVPCPLEDEDLPARMGEQAAVAADLDAAYMFTSAKAEGMSLDEAGAHLRMLGDAVGAYEVFLALETHPELCTNAERMTQTMAATDHHWVGVNYDTANVYYYNEGIDTVDQLHHCVSYVRGVHLKDTGGGFHDFDFPVFGEGIVDFAAVYEVLGHAGYTGACCMELEGPAFQRDQPDDLADKVGRCVEHLRSVGVVGSS
jgi:inosose dehydratase